MKTMKKSIAMAAIAFSLSACTGGNQGVHESGSADSGSMLNMDTQYVDTSGNDATNGRDGSGSDTSARAGSGKVPVPTP